MDNDRRNARTQKISGAWICNWRENNSGEAKKKNEEPVNNQRMRAVFIARPSRHANRKTLALGTTKRRSNLLADETNFHLDGVVNKQKIPANYLQKNPRRSKGVICCGVGSLSIIDPFIADRNNHFCNSQLSYSNKMERPKVPYEHLADDRGR